MSTPTTRCPIKPSSNTPDDDGTAPADVGQGRGERQGERPDERQGERAARAGRPTRELVVDENEVGSRLDTFLRHQAGLARLTALKAVRKGWVRVNGRRARPGQRLAHGDRVKFTNYKLPVPGLATDLTPAGDSPAGDSPASDSPASASARQPGNEPVERAHRPAARSRTQPPPALIAGARASLVHEDRDILVSIKPAGQVVHPGSGHAHGWAEALAWACEPASTTAIPVGRLDRDTSGLLVLARTRLAARRLFEDLRARSLTRTYLALVHGAMPGDGGTIDMPLDRRGPPGRQRMARDEGGRAARTHYRVLARSDRATLLAVELETGRTHQIRAHLCEHGHPLLGDPRYGSPASHRLGRELGLRRLFLHAGTLRFHHPRTAVPLVFTAPLDSNLASALYRAGIGSWNPLEPAQPPGSR